MNNRLRKKVKARAKTDYYFSKQKAILKYPTLKKTIEDFWKEIKLWKI
jgi:hypothetical protein